MSDEELLLFNDTYNQTQHFARTQFVRQIMKLQQENQSLKKENKILRENAEHNDKVFDKVNWENLKLKKQLEEYKLITIDYQELEARNKKLMKQLEEYKRLGFEHLNDKCNKLENQQKEFIEWLENEVNINSYDISDYAYEKIINTILSKYKEKIGGKYE